MSDMPPGLDRQAGRLVLHLVPEIPKPEILGRGALSNLNELPKFRYDPETETMYRKHGDGWVELGCCECDWTPAYPVNTVAVLSIDE